MQVLAVTCGLSDGADLAWWQPWRAAATQRPWLPWAIAVQVCPPSLPFLHHSVQVTTVCSSWLTMCRYSVQYCTCSQTCEEGLHTSPILPVFGMRIAHLQLELPQMLCSCDLHANPAQARLGIKILCRFNNLYCISDNVYPLRVSLAGFETHASKAEDILLLLGRLPVITTKSILMQNAL